LRRREMISLPNPLSTFTVCRLVVSPSSGVLVCDGRVFSARESFNCAACTDWAATAHAHSRDRVLKMAHRTSRHLFFLRPNETQPLLKKSEKKSKNAGTCMLCTRQQKGLSMLGTALISAFCLQRFSFSLRLCTSGGWRLRISWEKQVKRVRTGGCLLWEPREQRAMR